MKKETVGTVELLDQFYRVEVGDQLDAPTRCTNKYTNLQSTLLQDMFDFDNMGFTNTVEHIKFLSCGDCEVMFSVMENLSSVPFNELQRSGWTSWLPQSANQKKLFGPSKVVLVYLLR